MFDGQTHTQTQTTTIPASQKMVLGKSCMIRWYNDKTMWCVIQSTRQPEESAAAGLTTWPLTPRCFKHETFVGRWCVKLNPWRQIKTVFFSWYQKYTRAKFNKYLHMILSLLGVFYSRYWKFVMFWMWRHHGDGIMSSWRCCLTQNTLFLTDIIVISWADVANDFTQMHCA